MDVVLNFCDNLFYDDLYKAAGQYVPAVDVPRDNIYRIYASMYVITCLGGCAIYLAFATVAYLFLWNADYGKHKFFLKNQVKREIKYALWSIPQMAIPTTPIFVGEVFGYSQLHENFDGWFSFARDIVTFMLFTDMMIYWVHRYLHHPWFYHFHKPHHQWKVCSPFSSHAFHPVDGFMQGLPYHVYVYLFPMNKFLYLFMFLFVNMWTVSIHDGAYVIGGGVISTAAHHNDHHLYFNYNHGQYFTLWDRIGGTYMNPTVYEKGNYVLADARKEKSS
mmetsp:Transcript_32431/g.83999  ORF Transcript_32431/g.83999 Transcript_32431/m.83999 type:complete len:276 (-) Transcript_32431:31-858(-)